MSGLLLVLLLFAAGTLLAYRCSPASKIKKRMWDALSPFEELYADVRRLREDLEHEVDQSFTRYIQGVHAARLSLASG